MRLKTIRVERGLKQEDIEGEFDVSHVTISNYENGKTEPSLYILMKYAEHFEKSLDFIVYGKDSNSNIKEIITRINELEKKLR